MSGWVWYSLLAGDWLHPSILFSCRLYPTEQTYDGPGEMVTSPGAGRSSRLSGLHPVNKAVELALVSKGNGSSSPSPTGPVPRTQSILMSQFAPADLPSRMILPPD